MNEPQPGCSHWNIENQEIYMNVVAEEEVVCNTENVAEELACDADHVAEEAMVCKTNIQATNVLVESCDNCISLKSMNEKLIEELNKRTAEIFDLKEKLVSISQTKDVFTYSYLKNNPKHISFFTGAKNLQTLQWIIDLVKNDIKVYISKLTIEDEVIITLIKIRQGLTNRYIAINLNR